MELSIPTTNSYHDVPCLQVTLDDTGTHHVSVLIYHLDWHPYVVLLDQLSQSLIGSITSLCFILDSILEV